MRKLSWVIYWCCTLVMFTMPLFLALTVVDFSLFVSLIKQALTLQIHWDTVQDSQWLLLWVCVVGYVSIGLAGIYFLRKSFRHFAAGDWFLLNNSLNIRLFAKLLLIQSIATPVLFTVSGLILSLNHPPGQKILAISLGANEVKGVAVSLIFLVISHILVLGHTIDNENKQFL